MPGGFRCINLEDDQPTVEQAVKRLEYEIVAARRQQIKVMKIIHGYGSSGKGGKIRVAARRQLEGLQKRGVILYFIPGETLSIFDEATLKTVSLYPELRRDSDLEKHNNGVTIVVFAPAAGKKIL